MKNYLKLGDWNAICDSCGRKFKASMLQKRWDGLMVCKEDWELRHPQDFLRVQKEKIATEWSRKEAPDMFISVPYIDAYCLDNYVENQGMYVWNFEYPS
jgi:hypothetical protein